MNRQTGRLEFKLGAFGRLVPLLTAACMICGPHAASLM